MYFFVSFIGASLKIKKLLFMVLNSIVFTLLASNLNIIMLFQRNLAKIIIHVVEYKKWAW